MGREQSSGEIIVDLNNNDDDDDDDDDGHDGGEAAYIGEYIAP